MAYFEKGLKSNYKISARKITESPKSVFYDCEGDCVWIGKTVHSFDPKTGTLEIPSWLYDKEF
jgi:hypothetical protein